MKNERKGLIWLVIGLALAIRLLYFSEYVGTPFYAVPMWDADEYHTMALELSHGRFHPYLPYRPPVYPFLLGIVYILFGVGPLAPTILQIAGGVYACVLIQKIAGRLFGRWAGLGAGLTAALCGMMFYFDLELLPTSLEVLLLLLLLRELVKCADYKGEGRDTPPSPPPQAGGEIGGRQAGGESKGTQAGGDSPPVSGGELKGGDSGRLWLAGLWFALGALTRPVLLPLFPFIGWWLWRRKVGIRGLGIFSATALGPLLLSFLIHWVSGVGATSVAAQGGINFFIGNQREADGISATFPGVGTGWSWETVRKTAEAEVGHPLTPVEADEYYYHKGLAEITADPVQWFRLTFRKAGLFWNHLEISNNRDLYYQAHRYSLFGAFMWLGLTIFLPFALAGIWLWRRSAGVQLLVMTLVVYYAAVVPFFVNARFRHPLTPIFIILAAGGVAGIVSLGKNWRRTQLGEKLGTGAGLALGLILPWVSDSGIDPHRWDYGLFTEASALQRMGRIPESEALYKEALKVNPHAPFVNFNLGELAQAKGSSDRADDYFRKEIEIQPNYGQAWMKLGEVLLARGDEDEALGCFERAFQLRPELKEAGQSAGDIWLRRGISAMKAGNQSAAQGYFKHSADLAPDDPRPKEWLGRLEGTINKM